MRAAVVAVLLAGGGLRDRDRVRPRPRGPRGRKVAPATIIPGTKIAVKGASFVDTQWGDATLQLDGKAGGKTVDVSWPAKFVDFRTMTVAVDAAKLTELGGDVDFAGTAIVEVVATTDDNAYDSDPLDVDLSFRTEADADGDRRSTGRA